MKTLEITPLYNTVVTLQQLKRGNITHFINDIMTNRWHYYSFEISKEDARALFIEMKRAYKEKKQPAQIGTRGGWYIYIQDGLHPLLKKVNGTYILEMCSFHWRRG